MWNTGLENLALNTRKVNNPDYNEIVNWGFRYARNAIGDMVTVQGGTLPAGSELAGQKVQAFQIGRTEVTWDEWQTVRTWAVANGYTDLANIGSGVSAIHPVRNVNWYDAVKWCNAKSEMEGLTPAYTTGNSSYRAGSSIPTVNPTANGYRLPVEVEWEWAARGGKLSQGYVYSGGNSIGLVGWFWDNSNGSADNINNGRGPWPVARKAPNEIGVFDMSGGMNEWCWDSNGEFRRFRGGSWSGGETYCAVASRQLSYDHAGRYGDFSFRLARNIGPKISITGELPEAVLNQPYAGFTFGVSGTTAPLAWSISEGTLPPGMSFSTTGTLSGTPTTAGTYTFVIRLESGGYWDEVEVELEVVNPPSDISTGLMAYYPFNANSKDESGNGRHLEVLNSQIKTTGFKGGSLDQGQGNSYSKTSVTGSNAQELKSNKFTVSMWINPRTLDRVKEWVYLVQSTNGTAIRIGSTTTTYPNHHKIIGIVNNSNTFIHSSKINSLQENIWQQLVVTHDNGKTNYYLNGNNVFTANSSVMYFNFNNYILGNSGGVQYFYDGGLDEIRIYNRALTPNDVTKLYNYESDKTNLLVNGGFEQPNVVTQTTSGNNLWVLFGINYAILQPSDSGPKALDTPFTGWQVVSGEVDVMNNRVANSTPPEGMQFLDLDGSMPGVIMQTIATTIGQAYVFSFKHQKYAYHLNHNSSFRAEALSANNTQLVNSTVSITPTPDVPWEWVEFKTEFTATSNSTTIKFTSLSPGGSTNGVKIDDVRVSAKNYSEMVTVQGGTLPAGSELVGQQVSTFQIGKYEVTWGEWKTVRDWAVANGYTDLAGVGNTNPSGSADSFPVVDVSWYDVVKWSNARSEKEGLVPVYQVSGAIYKAGQSVPTVNSSANGYRLPSEVEWEWAARGGVSSQGFTYSGSNDVNAVSWYGDNSSSDGNKAVGTKAANELGIHDMSGNVWEWCEDVVYSWSARRIRGGSWSNDADYSTVAYRDSGDLPDDRDPGIGIRLARSSGN
jgi:formylglycine-generating enzyme required for sulfatase activity